MNFDKQHMVIIDSLKPNEARAFIKFLELEIIRHRDAIMQAGDKRIDCATDSEGNAFHQLWSATILRHQEDIIMTRERINQVIIKFGLVDKSEE